MVAFLYMSLNYRGIVQYLCSYIDEMPAVLRSQTSSWYIIMDISSIETLLTPIKGNIKEINTALEAINI